MTPQVNARAIVLDISEELSRYIEQIKVFTPDLQYSTIQEIFITALRCLHFSYNIREAVEALMLEITTNFCANIENSNDVVVLEIATKRFVDLFHDQLTLIQAYDKDEELNYTLGGWIHPYCPFLIPTTHIQKFAQAVPIVVESQYQIPLEYPHNSHYWNPALYLQEDKLPFDER